MTFIKILVEQTGVEVCVPPEYYEKYAGSGIRFLEEVDNEGNSLVKVEKEPTRPHEEPARSHEELKEACTLKGLTFRGNASKVELERLLED